MMRRPSLAIWIDMPSPIPPKPSSSWWAMSLKFHSIWSGMHLSINVMLAIRKVVDGRDKPGHDEIGLGPRPGLLHEIRAQRFIPIGDRGDLFLPQQDLGLLLHVGLQVRRETGIDIHRAHRLAECLLR